MKQQIKFRAWVSKDSAMIQHREVIERAHNQFSDSLDDGNTDVIMQYIGIKDKNRKEIYTGDIVKTQAVSDYSWNEDDTSKDINYIVGFHNGTYCLFSNLESQYPIRQWKDGTNDWYGIENCETFLMEVVGNIYENPELLN